MAKTAKPFRYRGKWRAQLTLENGVRLTRDFALGQHDEAVRWLAEQRANADSAHEPQLGGPTQATLAQALNLYAHLFTIGKRGAAAELCRINHYLAADGLPELKLIEEDGRRELQPKPKGPLPAAFAAHREKRLEKRQRTYAHLAELARKPCSRISAADIRTLQTRMNQDGLTSSTIQKEIALLKHMFNVAINEWEWKGFRNPCMGIKLGASVIRFVILSKEERTKLFLALQECDNPFFWPLVKVALLTALRRSSLLMLQWEAIDYTNKVAYVGSKTGRITVPLSQAVIDILKHMPRDSATGPVFPMTGNAVDAAWDGVRQKIGRPDLQFRDLRHIAATDLARKGASSEFLRRFLQHKTAHMANIYINLTQHDMLDQLDALQSEFITSELPPRSTQSAEECRRAKKVIRLVRAKRSDDPQPSVPDSLSSVGADRPDELRGPLEASDSAHRGDVQPHAPINATGTRSVAVSGENIIHVRFGKHSA